MITVLEGNRRAASSSPDEVHHSNKSSRTTNSGFGALYRPVLLLVEFTWCRLIRSRWRFLYRTERYREPWFSGARYARLTSGALILNLCELMQDCTCCFPSRDPYLAPTMALSWSRLDSPSWSSWQTRIAWAWCDGLVRGRDPRSQDDHFAPHLRMFGVSLCLESGPEFR
jgi:hypothetical protein